MECGNGEGVVAQGRVVLDPRGRSGVREGCLGLSEKKARPRSSGDSLVGGMWVPMGDGGDDHVKEKRKECEVD